MSFLEIEVVRPARRTRRKTCPRCGGRGWTLVLTPICPGAFEQKFGNGNWPDPCARCNGSGAIKPLQLARALGVNRRDVYKVDTLTAGTKVGLRVLAAIARAFPEALT